VISVLVITIKEADCSWFVFQIHFEITHGARTCKIRAGSDLWHSVHLVQEQH